MPGEGKRFEHHVDILGGRFFWNAKWISPRKVHVQVMFAVPGVPASLQLQGVLEGGVVIRDTAGMFSKAAEAFKAVAALVGARAPEPPDSSQGGDSKRGA